MPIEKYLTKEGFSFSVIPNEAITSITDPVALAVFVYLASKPDDWIIRESEVSAHFGFGLHSWRKAARYLKDHGWMRAEKIRSADGKLAGTRLVLVCSPGSTESENFRHSVKPRVGKSTPLVNKENIQKKEWWFLPEWVNAQSWADWEQYRKGTRGWNDLARAKAVNKLNGLSKQDQADVIDNSIQAGWTGLFPDKRKTTKNREENSGYADYAI